MKYSINILDGDFFTSRRQIMKKTSVLITSLCALSAAVAMAAGSATSVNIVGYQTLTCETGKWMLVSSAFQSIDGTPLKCANVFSNQLPKGTSVFVYNPVSAGYDVDSKQGLGQGVWGTNITFAGGMGFWIFTGSPVGGPASYNVTMAGQVPLDLNATNSVYNGFNMLGFPYTASVTFTNTQLYKTSMKGDSLFLWNGNGYDAYSKQGLGAGIWSPSPDGVVFTPQTGFFYKSVSNLHLNVESRPYTP